MTYNNKLDELAVWSMVLATEQVVLGLRGILAAAGADPTMKDSDVAHELLLMLARDDSNPER